MEILHFHYSVYPWVVLSSYGVLLFKVKGRINMGSFVRNGERVEMGLKESE